MQCIIWGIAICTVEYSVVGFSIEGNASGCTCNYSRLRRRGRTRRSCRTNLESTVDLCQRCKPRTATGNLAVCCSPRRFVTCGQHRSSFPNKQHSRVTKTGTSLARPFTKRAATQYWQTQATVAAVAIIHPRAFTTVTTVRRPPSSLIVHPSPRVP